MNIEAGIGPNIFRIIAIDPADAQKIFLLVLAPTEQSLAISTDGGVTFTTPVHYGVALTAFARLASGTILVAGLESDATGNSTRGVGFRSSDGGKTFTPWAVPQLRVLAERDGKLYGAADNFLDGFALGVSTNEGMTFQPLMKYSDVSSIRSCVKAACLDTCNMLAALKVWSEDLCNNNAIPAPQPGKGGGCAMGEDFAGSAWWLALVALGLWRARRNVTT